MLLKQPSQQFWVWLVKLTNQANLFDCIVQRKGQAKHIPMYYKRRFTKLGYSAASILQSLPYLHMLLNESHLSNQHIEILWMFLDLEFLITNSRCLHISHTFLFAIFVLCRSEFLECASWNISSFFQWPETQHYWQFERILSRVTTCSSHPTNNRKSKYKNKCLQQCKRWHEPATSVEEFHTILLNII